LEGGSVLLAFIIGTVGSLPFFFLAQVWAYGFVGVAGLVAAWLVSDRRRGLVGLLLGIAAPFTIYGAYEVARKIESCQASPCSGISSPNLTVAIAVALGLIGLASGAAGYILGRVARAVALRLGNSR
jgi:hypothetical protein